MDCFLLEDTEAIALGASWSGQLFERSGMGGCVFRREMQADGAVNYRVVDFNASFGRIGNDSIRIEKGIFLDDNHHRNDPELVSSLESVWKNRRGRQREVRRTTDGKWFLVWTMVIDSDDDSLVGILTKDITRRKQRDREILERKLRYEKLLDGLEMPVWMMGVEFDLQYVNRAFDDLFGKHYVLSGPSGWGQLIHPEDLSGFIYTVGKGIREQCGFKSLLRIRVLSGDYRWMSATFMARHSFRGQFIGFYGYTQDVTEQRALEADNEQLLRAERKARSVAENASRVKDEFLATISHELRTPLTTILGWSDLLLNRVDPKDPAFKGLNVISSSAQALKRLIGDMLDLSSMMMGKHTLDMQKLDLSEEVRDSVHSLDIASQARNLDVEVDVPDYPCPIWGDRTRVQQMLWNLLSNAAKFTSEGGQVWVKLMLRHGMYELRVIDTGVGIAKDYIPSLFTRFSQADGTTTKKHGGLGLGLAIVKQLIELHGGTAHAESDGIGRGATFILKFPRFDEEDINRYEQERRGRAKYLQAVGTDSEALQNIRLLLVDDQEEILEYLRAALERHGAQVHTACNAADALRLIGSSDHARYDMVISDIGMPGMDGYALAHTIREDMGMPGSTLPMIALTALARVEDQQRALGSGFQSHVSKPCNMAVLVKEICRLSPHLH